MTSRGPGTSSEAQAEIKQLKKQIAELEKANAILRSASVSFATELIRRRGQWRTVEQIELATLEYVWW